MLAHSQVCSINFGATLFSIIIYDEKKTFV